MTYARALAERRLAEVLRAQTGVSERVDVDKLGVGARDSREEPPLAEHDVELRVVDHPREALARQPRLERDIRTTGLEHGEQRHNHVDRPLHADADANLGTDTQLAQVPGKTVRAPIHLVICRRRPAAPERRHVRSARDLSLEQRNDALVVGVGHRRPVPLIDSSPPDVVADERQLVRPRVWLGRSSGEQRRVVPAQRLDRVGGEQVGAVLELDLQALASLADRADEIKGSRRALQVDDIVARLGFLLLADPRGVEQLERNLEQRVAAQIALRSELADETREGQVLMRVRVERRPADLPQQFAERRPAGEVGPQDERIDEEPDQALDLGAVPVGRERPDHHVLFARVAAKQRLEPGQQHHEQRGSLLATEGPERRGHRAGNRDVVHRAAPGGNRRARPVRWQLDHRQVGQLPLPV